MWVCCAKAAQRTHRGMEQGYDYKAAHEITEGHSCAFLPEFFAERNALAEVQPVVDYAVEHACCQ